MLDGGYVVLFSDSESWEYVRYKAVNKVDVLGRWVRLSLNEFRTLHLQLVKTWEGTGGTRVATTSLWRALDSFVLIKVKTSEELRALLSFKITVQKTSSLKHTKLSFHSNFKIKIIFVNYLKISSSVRNIPDVVGIRSNFTYFITYVISTNIIIYTNLQISIPQDIPKAKEYIFFLSTLL